VFPAFICGGPQYFGVFYTEQSQRQKCKLIQIIHFKYIPQFIAILFGSFLSRALFDVVINSFSCRVLSGVRFTFPHAGSPYIIRWECAKENILCTILSAAGVSLIYFITERILLHTFFLATNNWIPIEFIIYRVTPRYLECWRLSCVQKQSWTKLSAHRFEAEMHAYCFLDSYDQMNAPLSLQRIHSKRIERFMILFLFDLERLARGEICCCACYWVRSIEARLMHVRTAQTQEVQYSQHLICIHTPFMLRALCKLLQAQRLLTWTERASS
jgi:hypothetical protein